MAIVFAVAGISTMVTGLARTDAQADGLTSIHRVRLRPDRRQLPAARQPAGRVRRLALLTPNGWALRAFTQIGAADATVVGVADLVVLLVMGAVGTVVGIRGVRAKVTG